jgi:RNA polymerase sigma-70 factor (ECF subfamily)
MSVGDLAELNLLFETYRDRLLAMLRRRIDPALAVRLDAEDLLNETYILARRQWDHPSRARMPPYPWLYRLAKDCLIEAWRRENRQRRSPDREQPWPERSSIQLALSLVDSASSPSKAVAREELQAGVCRAMEGLKPAEREILWMRHRDGLSYREAAAVLNISEDAAAQRYARALRKLKDRWRDSSQGGSSCQWR